MTKLLFVGVGMLILLSVLVLFPTRKDPEKAPGSQRAPERSVTPTHVPYEGKELLFVPYWTMSSDDSSLGDYEEIAYFGISVNEDGIDHDEEGYQRLSRFKKIAPESAVHLLTVRVVNSQVESQILRDQQLQNSVITESIEVAHEYDFDGIVLDYESSALGFAGTIKRITDLHTAFSRFAKKEDLLFYSTIYGDTYFRSRPYEVAEIAKVSDKIVVMAYDFHKARGEAGPTFPFEGKEYPYNFQKMVSDFSRDVPADKLLVVLGLFGYDWRVDGQGNTLEIAEPISYLQGKGRFLESCQKSNCRIRIDDNSRETKVEYTDEQGDSHVVWFETPESAREKKEYLDTKGVKNTGWWAYSFF